MRSARTLVGRAVTLPKIVDRAEFKGDLDEAAFANFVVQKAKKMPKRLSDI